MASEGWEKDEEMGSLFEGMVLFNPSELAAAAAAAAPPPPDDQQEHDHRNRSIIPPPAAPPANDSAPPLLRGLQPQSDPSSCPSTSATATATATVSIATKTSTASTITTASREVRQFATRKKKRAGLRIGYGRDDALIPGVHSHYEEPELHPSSPPPSPGDQITIKSGGALSLDRQGKAREIEEDENDFSDKTSESIDSSHTSADEGFTRIGGSVSDAEAASSSRDFREEDDKRVENIHPVEIRFDQIRAQISDKLKHARELVASVSSARKVSIRRRRKAAENLTMASAKYKELEKELEEACEAEDFEAAERVSESLASAEKEKELSLSALKGAEADCDAVDSKMEEVLKSQIAVEEESASLLQSFAIVSRKISN
ncbi:unnamed protein product [Ilex paraguariensis]|uniref:Uncharacterized protein n=1 Tax=Ilex paraguariensis TaxID=185542 RepID=A0ABC8UQX6_9AQUA